MAQLISLYRLVCFACCCCSLFCFLPSVLSAPRSSSSYDGNGGKWRCGEEAKKEVDEMVARIMTFGRQDRKFPVNKAQFKPYCKEQLNMIARLEDYKSSCLKDRSKQTVAIIIYSMKNVVGTYCRNPNSKRTTELINSASCANEATTAYARCNSEYIDLLLAVENSKDAKQQLVQLCCGYVEVFKCIRSSAASLAGCTESQVEANVNYIRGFFDNASNLICSDYSAESDKCDRVKLLKRKGIRPPPANSNSWPQSSFSRPQSYFNPLVHLLSSL